jgi:glutamate N-acetyltransferase/amino-acid N-acetyltransferase
VSVTAVPGFEAGGIACGVKPSGAPDLALVATTDHRAVSAAGVFTTNLATAAPVQISRQHLADGHAAAVVLNSGNANAATGEHGRDNAVRMCELAGAGIGVPTGDVLVCSTGLIGIPLPMAPLEAGIPKLATQLRADAAGGAAAADALLTTDTVRKEAYAEAELAAGLVIRAGGMAKGAAMLAPAMATMLAVVTTDADIAPGALHAALEHAVENTFNALVVDACTSTNDTVLVLANGRAGNEPIEAPGGHAYHAFTEALTAVCDSLAAQMAADAEGATKLARVVVRGARSADEARRAARAVASSQLVQCSLYGADPYWGRVLSELGASGAFLDQERVNIAYNGITVCRDGVGVPHDETALEAAMAGRDIEILCDLRQGRGEATVRFTDLTHAYVDENMGTS